ncbi:unnamed protein product, partial [Brassica rapa subsp. trilocularis]
VISHLESKGRHLVGVPLAPGDSECVEYFKETKARDWTVVRRAEVWRCIPFIDSACWRKMDLSEIPRLIVLLEVLMMLLLSLVSVPPVWSLRHLLVVLLW